MLLTQELADSIEELYLVFESYRLKESTGPCPCCHSTQDDTQLRSKLLRKLDHKDLAKYAMDALYVWGDEEDSKHFLPRIFELLTNPETKYGFVDAEAAFLKLIYEAHNATPWRSWPAPERRAITRYFRATWDAVLDTEPDELDYRGAYSWLCAIAQAEHDISSFLDRWLAASSVNANRNLVLMISREGVPNLLKPDSGYWGQRREQWQQLVDWLRLPQVRRKLELAIKQWANEPFGGELFDAAVLLPS
jgi:hypothetical protein